MDFDSSGNYLAVGDCGGRVILFKRNPTQPSARKYSEVCNLLTNFFTIQYQLYF